MAASGHHPTCNHSQSLAVSSASDNESTERVGGLEGKGWIRLSSLDLGENVGCVPQSPLGQGYLVGEDSRIVVAGVSW